MQRWNPRESQKEEGVTTGNKFDILNIDGERRIVRVTLRIKDQEEKGDILQNETIRKWVKVILVITRRKSMQLRMTWSHKGQEKKKVIRNKKKIRTMQIRCQTKIMSQKRIPIMRSNIIQTRSLVGINNRLQINNEQLTVKTRRNQKRNIAMREEKMKLTQ